MARVCEEVPYLLLLANPLIAKVIIKIIPFFHRKPYFSSRRYKERLFSSELSGSLGNVALIHH